MFAFADPQRVSRILTASGWAQPRLERVELKLDIAAGSGLEEAVGQSIRVGAASSALRNQPSERVSAAVASIRGALAAHCDGPGVWLPAAVWQVSSAAE